MNKETLTCMSLEEAIRRKGTGLTDWNRLRREEAAGIEPEIDEEEEGEFSGVEGQVYLMPR